MSAAFDSLGGKIKREKKKIVVTGMTLLSFFLIPLFVLYITNSTWDFRPVSLLFNLLWSLIFTAVLTLLPTLARRIVYAVTYMLLLVYGFAQYVYYGFFGTLISFSSFANAGEGADYLSAIFEKMGVGQFFTFLMLIFLGVEVTFLVGHMPRVRLFKGRLALTSFMLAAFLVIQLAMPLSFGLPRKSFTWTPGSDLRYVYDNFLDRQACLGMSGYYQYLSLDFYNCFVKPLFVNTAEQKAAVDDFFGEYRAPHADNDMTGIFKGKNVVLIMMESMDMLALGDEKNTPNIHYMMENGINFTNYYAPLYSDGATFSNEFSLNTGIITPTDGKTLYNYQNNTYSRSLANLFEEAGYSANSYHENYGSFYNREAMHMSFGYDRYHSYYNYGGTTEEVELDTYLTRTPALMEAFLGDGEKPFFNFLITYSAHLSYYYGERMTAYAYENYVGAGELRSGPEDLNCLQAKARITDDMLGELVEACPEDTVFICATDHYCYGLSDYTKSLKLGNDENLRQRVPFFIYSKSDDLKPMTVDKYCANVDFFPTVANLMGLDAPEYTLGNDIFDPDFEGYVIFSDYSILNSQAYYKDGVISQRFTEKVDLEKLHQLTEYAYRRAECSNNILSSNYYKDYKLR